MTARNIRVLVVDDSAFMRKTLVKMLESLEDIEVVGTAMDGVFALDKVARFKPDVVTLDLEMPRMDGLTALDRMVGEFEIPVILVSAHTSEGAKATFDGLAAGAVDFVTKPERIFTTPLDGLRAALVEKIRTAVGARVNPRRRPTTAGQVAPGEPPIVAGSRAVAVRPPARDVVAVAVSTGGPNALAELLPGIRSDFEPALLIVQHMPEGFTAQFAERLERLTSIEVREAKDGDLVASGLALVAPGGQHMVLAREAGRLVVSLNRDEPVRGHRPSADVLFRSVAAVARERSVGLIMTGMGEDGADGMEAIHLAGGLTLAQDEASSVVYGMPRAAIQRGAVSRVLPLAEVAPFLNALGSEQRGTSWIS